MDRLIEQLNTAWESILVQFASPTFYSQIGFVIVALLAAWALTLGIKARVRIFREEPTSGALLDMRMALHNAGDLVLPVLTALLLGVVTPVAASMIGEAWLVRAAQGIAFILLAFSLANHFISSTTIIFILRWIGVPIALLFIVGLLDDVTGHLDSVSFAIGNIEVTLLAVLRTFLFGILLFWFGRVSNSTGQRVIRNRTGLDISTREVIAKLFEIGVYVLMLLLLLNIVGIDLTALAVFGGALGVGLGFGLQQIASNFVSGIIILLDRSITIGDYIELEVRQLAEMVGMPDHLLTRFPHQLSGGQKARVGIARAIALRPKLLVLDEPTSALDVSVQAVVLKLLARLRQQLGMTYLFVSHDLNVVRLLCDRVIVMNKGRIVESGTASDVLIRPRNDYTKALIAAIPHFDPTGGPEGSLAV